MQALLLWSDLHLKWNAVEMTWCFFLSLHFPIRLSLSSSLFYTFSMPSKRDSDRSQSPRKKAKYKESKSHRYDRKIRRAKTKARSGKAKVMPLLETKHFNSISWKNWICSNGPNGVSASKTTGSTLTLTLLLGSTTDRPPKKSLFKSMRNPTYQLLSHTWPMNGLHKSIGLKR